MPEKLNLNRYTNFDLVDTPWSEEKQQVKAHNPRIGRSRLVTDEELLRAHNYDPNDPNVKQVPPAERQLEHGQKVKIEIFGLQENDWQVEDYSYGSVGQVLVRVRGPGPEPLHLNYEQDELLALQSPEAQAAPSPDAHAEELQRWLPAEDPFNWHGNFTQPASTAEELNTPWPRGSEFKSGQRVRAFSLKSLSFEDNWRVGETFERDGEYYVRLTKEDGDESDVKEVLEAELEAWQSEDLFEKQREVREEEAQQPSRRLRRLLSWLGDNFVVKETDPKKWTRVRKIAIIGAVELTGIGMTLITIGPHAYAWYKYYELPPKPEELPSDLNDLDPQSEDTPQDTAGQNDDDNQRRAA